MKDHRRHRLGIMAGAIAANLVEAGFTLAGKERAEKALRAGGHTMLDCPLSGTGAQAKVKDLSVYASGDSAAIARLNQRRRGRDARPRDEGRARPEADPPGGPSGAAVRACSRCAGQ